MSRVLRRDSLMGQYPGQNLQHHDCVASTSRGGRARCFTRSRKASRLNAEHPTCMMDALDEEELVVSLVFRMQLPSRHTFRSQTPTHSTLTKKPKYTGIWPPDVPKRPLMSRASVLH